VLDLAVYYAEKRWPVFPLAEGCKVPAIPKARGGHGCLDATLDVNRIKAWWQEYPQANIGIATGRRSGLLVIDVDPRKTSDWLASVNLLKLPETFRVRTASGGFHFYFGLPTASKITIGAALLPGIDWRGNGGYVVGAGSVVNDVTYEIVQRLAIAPAPSGLLERIAWYRKGSRFAAVNDTGRMVIPDGRRNTQLFRVACALRRFGVDLNALCAALEAINADHCSPPMTAARVRAVAASAMRYMPDATAHPIEIRK
jgi:putative DNA primase/helicase